MAAKKKTKPRGKKTVVKKRQSQHMTFFSKRPKKIQFSPSDPTLLIVVANVRQIKPVEAQYGKKEKVLVLHANDILQNGVMSNYVLAGVEWKPGWAMECPNPETVVARIHRRLRVHGVRVPL